MKLEILTPEKRLYRDQVEIITLPGVMGSFQVLNNHAPMVAALVKGTLSFTAKGKTEEIKIEDGVLEVHDNKVVICLDNAVEQVVN
ncbi:MAG: ATP synthase F1 subunit epsilon [Bacteroidota bacterium]|jgi:F-type H+-transporting ATPase subunit epsilon|nr:ATP synthase F1 subunit epsilon [Bacteroidota bacterium]HHU95930.1 ATP synthase F1 subunit epsilon [Petrimonas sp.]